MFSNRMLRKICGAKKERVNGGWIKLNNKELYPSLNINGKDINKEDEMGGKYSIFGSDEIYQRFS
jgi:hypothetical protein